MRYENESRKRECVAEANSASARDGVYGFRREPAEEGAEPAGAQSGRAGSETERARGQAKRAGTTCAHANTPNHSESFDNAVAPNQSNSIHYADSHHHAVAQQRTVAADDAKSNYANADGCAQFGALCSACKGLAQEWRLGEDWLQRPDSFGR